MTSNPPPTIPPATPVSEVPHGGTAARRDHVLYARVTADEKERIVDRAREARLSISRYLTRFVLDGKAPPTAGERARLEELLALFRRAESGLRIVEAQARESRLFASMPGIEQEIRLTGETLSRLSRELAKRV